MELKDIIGGENTPPVEEVTCIKGTDWITHMPTNYRRLSCGMLVKCLIWSKDVGWFVKYAVFNSGIFSYIDGSGKFTTELFSFSDIRTRPVFNVPIAVSTNPNDTARTSLLPYSTMHNYIYRHTPNALEIINRMLVKVDAKNII